LTAQQAAERLDTYGRNVIADRPRRPIALQILARLGNPLVLLLLGAAVVSWITGDARSAIVILVMVVLSVTLDFTQEHRAGKAAERLREAARVRATVIRDGVAQEVAVTEVVPGDVVKLTAGDLVPADGEVIDSRDLLVNQARLTGEPFPVEKSAAGPAAPDGAGAEHPRVVLMGSSIASGGGIFVVSRTGRSTVLGGIGASLEKEPPPSAFEQGTRSFGLLIVRLASGMVLFAILVNAWRGRPWLESFMFAVALAVGLTPEMLPMVVSVTLARGAMRMSRQKVLVKRLAAIHDLGSMDVLCTDKTGTLTEACLRLEQHLDVAGRDSARVLELAYLNSWFQAGLRSPLDQAILAHAGEFDVSPWTKLDEIPFDFERRRLSVLVRERRDGAAPLLVVKGAFEDILRLSTRVETGAGEVAALDRATREQLLTRFEQLGREGFRVLGVGWAALPVGCADLDRDVEPELVLAGLLAFQDPPKESARQALRELERLGVTLKVVSGDNELVTEHVCRELDLPIAGILRGEEIQAMDDTALEASVENVTLFCRVTPSQKNRVLLALKRRKHVVGFLGDGINDAPALHTADVGISVDGAVDVAKEAADLILLEHDLAVLRAGVLEGRRTLANIVKYVLMGTSSNFGNMFSMAGASVLLPFLPMRPIQILVNNLLYDISEMTIPTDKVDDDLVARPHRWDIRFIQRFMIVLGPVSSAFDFLTFYFLARVFGATETAFQSGWFVESLATQVLVIFVIRTRGNPFRSRPSRTLTLAALLTVLVAVALPVSPIADVLGFVRPPTKFLLVLPAMILAYLATVEVVKRRFYARFDMS
jgi:Mg2+-importing ATPase